MLWKLLMFCLIFYLLIFKREVHDLKFRENDKNNYHAAKAELCLRVANASNDKLRVRFYGRKKKNTSIATATTATTGKFTIILLPDTQFYTAEPQGTNGGNNTIFKQQVKWIAKNRIQKNIVYVGHLGDCANNGDKYEVEWARGDTAIKPLENSGFTGLPEGIPYGICVGNHDQSPSGSAAGSSTFYNKYFGSARFTGRSYYGGHFNSNNDNFYELFNVGNIDFLVICFEYDLTTNFTAAGGALDWGESLIKSYPDCNVIVLSHYVLKADGTFSVQGNNIYRRFKVYSNFKLMFGGHVGDPAEAIRKDTYDGNTVYTILSNYQGRENGGNGRLRIYEFDPVNKEVSVKTYSPYTDTYETDSNSQFNINVSLILRSNFSGNTNLANSSVNTGDIFHLVSEVQNVKAGSALCVQWNSLEENTNYEWYAEVFDGKNKITSALVLFKTVHLSGVESENELISSK